MGKIYLKGIKIYGFHGCLKEEKNIGSCYIINLMVKTNLEKSSKSDNLNDTIDYSSLYNIVEEEMKIKSSLLENVVDRIINKIFNSFDSVSKTIVEVSKINPPINGDIQQVSVERKRKRSLK